MEQSEFSEDSLKETLQHNIEDMEVAVRQLAESLVLQKEARISDTEIGVKQLIEILKTKESQLQEALKLAGEQAERQALIEHLEEELQRRDAYVDKLQGCLKEAETVLISAVFQANQKLKSINQANHRKVDPEELIKFAHKISKTNAVAAPLTWQQGDPERPFPTDAEMRKGWLARPNQPPAPTLPSAGPPGPSYIGGQPTSSSTPSSVSHTQILTGGGGRFAHPAVSPRQSMGQGTTPPQLQGMQMHAQMMQRQNSSYQGMVPHGPPNVQVPGTPPIGAFVNSPRFPVTSVGSPGAQGAMIPPPPPYSSGWRGSQRFNMPPGGAYGPHSPRSMRQTSPFPPPQGRHASPSMQT